MAFSLALAASCGGGGLLGDTSGNPADAPYEIRPQSSDLQVDLPGRVTMFLQVVDGAGIPVDTMTDSDFRLFENGAPVSATESGQRTLRDPQSFRSFSHLIIDRSSSVQGQEALIRLGSYQYLQTLFGAVIDGNGVVVEPPDPDLQATTFIKLSWFDGSEEIHPIAGHPHVFTNDLATLLAAIADLFLEPPFNGSTNLYGAVLDGLDDLDEIDVEAEMLGVQNRTLTLVTYTDGTHRAGNNITLESVTNRLATQVNGRRKYSAFSIGVGTEIDLAVLDAIGPQGRAENTTDLIVAFTQSGEQVRRLANSFYVLSYCSPKTSGTNELIISASTSASHGTQPFPFEATGFGAGCAFLNVRPHQVIGGGAQSSVPGLRFADAIEDAEGRIVACGWRGADCQEPGCTQSSQGVVVRFHPDGSLDESLAPMGGGIVELAVTAAPSGASGIDLLDDGTIVVGGWVRNGQSARANLWTIDPATGTATRHEIASPSLGDEVVFDVVAESGTNARVFACGYVPGTAGPVAAIWARRADDLSQPGAFGAEGRYVDPLQDPVASRVARSIALHQSDGVVIAGDGLAAVPSSVNGGRDVLVVRVDIASAEPDPSFGNAGRVVATAVCVNQLGQPVFPGRARRVLVDSSDRIVVAGTVFSTNGSTPLQQPGVWRFLPTGAPDAAGFHGSASAPFYRSGLVTLRRGSTQNPMVDFGRDSVGASAVLGPLGDVLLVGHRSNFQDHRDMALVSFRSNGIPDGYNVVGYVIDDGAIADDSDDLGQAVVLHSSGAVVVLGSSSSPTGGVPTGAGPDVPVVWVDPTPANLFGTSSAP